MSHPNWVMVSFLTELLSTYGGLGEVNGQCANDTEVIDALLKETYNKVVFVIFAESLCFFYDELIANGILKIILYN